MGKDKVGKDKGIWNKAPISLPLPPLIRNALETKAAQDQREVTELIQRILADYLIGEGLIDDHDAHRMRLMWGLVDDVAETAREICRSGKFQSSITLDAIQACTSNPKWAADYEEFVQDDIYKSGNPLKGPINREFGYRVRAGIGGKVVKRPDGRPAVVKVLGQIIQGYTPMASYDPDAVKKRRK